MIKLEGHGSAEVKFAVKVFAFQIDTPIGQHA
jgi:hypothetical protein